MSLMPSSVSHLYTILWSKIPRLFGQSTKMCTIRNLYRCYRSPIRGQGSIWCFNCAYNVINKIYETFVENRKRGSQSKLMNYGLELSLSLSLLNDYLLIFLLSCWAGEWIQRRETALKLWLHRLIYCYICFMCWLNSSFQQGRSNESGRYTNEAFGNHSSNKGLLAASGKYIFIRSQQISFRWEKCYEKDPPEAIIFLIQLSTVIFFQNDLWVLSRTLINLIRAWISNHLPSKVWDEITYPFPTFNDATVATRKWMIISSHTL